MRIYTHLPMFFLFFSLFPVVFHILPTSNVRKKITIIKNMKTLELEFTQLVKEYKNTIYTVCYMFSEDSEEVNDLFQETLVNMWRGFKSFKGESSIATWIWRITLNTCISSERKKKTNQLVPLSVNINLFDSTDDDNRQIQMLHERISRLKPFDRAIVLLWLEKSVMRKLQPSLELASRMFLYVCFA